jgi:hypothetical protein
MIDFFAATIFMWFVYFVMHEYYENTCMSYEEMSCYATFHDKLKSKAKNNH